MRKLLASRGVRNFFHFTDKSNAYSIKKLGGLYSWKKLCEMKAENVCAGGNAWSHDADYIAGVDRYVHLCFLQAHPMEYIARTEGRISQVIWIKVNISVLDDIEGICFTRGVSNKADMPLLTVDEAMLQLDFQAIYDFIDFRVEGNMERKKQAEKYEILVPEHVPLSYLVL